MFYIFNANNDCVSTIDSKPDMADLASRNETPIESNENYDISKIKLLNGSISESETDYVQPNR